MIQTLDNYGYIESVLLKPKTYNYDVTISSNDHVITVEDNGDLLAQLGLEISGQTLSLIGKEGESIADVELPGATGIKNITYDSGSTTIHFVVNQEDGTEGYYDIELGDLVAVYQSGAGIEIDSDNKISVKISDDSASVLSADDEGLAINLTDYVLKSEIPSLSGQIYSAISGSVKELIKEETKSGSTTGETTGSTGSTTGETTGSTGSTTGETTGSTGSTTGETIASAITPSAITGDPTIVKIISGISQSAVSADIKSLEEKINALSGEVSANTVALSGTIDFVSGNVSANTEAIEALDNKIDEVSGAVSANTDAIEELNEKVDEISGKTLFASDFKEWSSTTLNSIYESEEEATKAHDDLTQYINDQISSLSGSLTSQIADAELGIKDGTETSESALKNYIDKQLVNYATISYVDSGDTDLHHESVSFSGKLQTEIDDLDEKITNVSGVSYTKGEINNMLRSYATISKVNDMIATAEENVLGSANTNTSKAVNDAKTELKEYCDNTYSKINSGITTNSTRLATLSACYSESDNKYDTTKAMTTEGTGVFDEVYRTLHKMLNDFDENDLTKLNEALKALIKKED